MRRDRSENEERLKLVSGKEQYLKKENKPVMKRMELRRMKNGDKT